MRAPHAAARALIFRTLVLRREAATDEHGASQIVAAAGMHAGGRYCIGPNPFQSVVKFEQRWGMATSLMTRRGQRIGRFMRCVSDLIEETCVVKLVWNRIRRHVGYVHG